MALPGVKTILRDRFGGLSRTDIPAGVTVAAVARRSNVGGNGSPPDYDPYTARSGADVVTAFGAGSELHRAYMELLTAGAARIVLVPMPASVADADLTSTVANNPFDMAFDAVEAVQPDIVVPWGRGGHPTDWVDPAARGVTADDVANTFTTAAAHNLYNGVRVVFGGTALPTGITAGTGYYVVGIKYDESGNLLTPNTFQVSLTSSGQAVDFTGVGTAVTATPTPPPFGFVADNSTGTTTSLVKRVAQRMKDMTDRSNPVFAVMGVKPHIPTTNLPRPLGNVLTTELPTHFNFTGLIGRNDDVMNEHGSYVNVVVAEMKLAGLQDEWGYTNGASSYAGFISGTDSWVATTGRATFNVRGLRYVPSRTQQETLINKGLVPVTQNYDLVAAWVDGLTFAKDTSDYGRLSTMRIVFDAMSVVRQTAQRFVGQPATLHHRNALETAITSALNGMMKRGALLNADFVVTYIPRENKAVVDLVLTPAFELRNIEVSVSVQL